MKNNLKSLAFVFTTVLFLNSCAVSVPQPNEYRLAIQAQKVAAKESKCKKASLKVQNAYCDDIFMSESMYYIEGKYSEYAYSQSKWAQTPQTMITKAFTENIRAMELFKSVQSSESKTKNDFLLEITIDDFMQYFDKSAKNSFVKVTITCALVDMKTHRAYVIKTFAKEMKTPSNDALGGVEALSNALNEVVEECDVWLRGTICHDK